MKTEIKAINKKRWSALTEQEVQDIYEIYYKKMEPYEFASMRPYELAKLISEKLKKKNK